jgi:leader peptidase (prepilin peptidase)/N-methyltransferase
MYINDLHILTYVVAGIIGLFIGQFVDWCSLRMPEYKKVFSRDFFKEYLKNTKLKYLLMVIVAVAYVALLYFTGLTIDTVKFMVLIPMLMIAFLVDYKLQIIPNRLTLTIFEFGLIFTFAETLLNTNLGINIFINNILGMLVGGGIFLLITLIGGALAGKEAMGFGDVKLMGALGLFFGWVNMIIISVMAFLFAAVVSIIILISRRKKINEYIPFGPFIVVASIIPMYLSTPQLILILLKIFSLGTY